MPLLLVRNDITKMECDAIVNAANEKANELFRNGKIRFLDIPKAVEAAFDYTADVSDYTLEQVFETDSLIRSETERLFI